MRLGKRLLELQSGWADFSRGDMLDHIAVEFIWQIKELILYHLEGRVTFDVFILTHVEFPLSAVPVRNILHAKFKDG